MELKITRDIIKNASDYMTYEEKESWVSETAPKCFDKLSITTDSGEVPSMYMVNLGLKNRYLMTALVGGYLKTGYEPDESDEHLMSIADYNHWAGNHVMNQIDRLKRDSEVRDKCYDLLYDFRELEKLLSAQIYGLLNVQNDPVIRQSEQMASAVAELPQLLNELKDMQEAKEIAE